MLIPTSVLKTVKCLRREGLGSCHHRQTQAALSEHKLNSTLAGPDLELRVTSERSIQAPKRVLASTHSVDVNQDVYMLVVGVRLLVDTDLLRVVAQEWDDICAMLGRSWTRCLASSLVALSRLQLVASLWPTESLISS